MCTLLHTFLSGSHKHATPANRSWPAAEEEADFFTLHTAGQRVERGNRVDCRQCCRKLVETCGGWVRQVGAFFAVGQGGAFNPRACSAGT